MCATCFRNMALCEYEWVDLINQIVRVTWTYVLTVYHKARPNTHNKKWRPKAILQLVLFSFRKKFSLYNPLFFNYYNLFRQLVFFYFGKKFSLYNPLFFNYYNLYRRMHTIVLDLQ
jgi:hypothetical protein